MATTIVMPKMGYDMREGTVVRWYKQEGEEVSRGEVIADIETDKATVEFEAYTGGVLHQLVAQEGIPVAVGDAIAVIAEPGESVEVAPPQGADVTIETAAETPTPAPDTEPTRPPRRQAKATARYGPRPSPGGWPGSGELT